MSTAHLLADSDIWSERKRYLPTNYVGETSEFTAEDIQPEQLFQERNINKTIVPLWNIKTDNKIYKTKKPIKVIVYEDDGLYFAGNDNLNICGYGETKEKAIIDLGLHIIYYFNYYNKMDESELIGDGIRLKHIYSKLLV